MGFDRAEFGCGRRQRDRADAELFERGEDFLAPGVAEVRRKKATIADNDAESSHRCNNYMMPSHFAINFSDHHTSEPDGSNIYGATNEKK